jgi:DNA-binding IclR family transcriptional regulator
MALLARLVESSERTERMIEQLRQELAELRRNGRIYDDASR